MATEDQNKKSRCNFVTYLRGVHAATALALATTLERLHLAILLYEHRLCVWPAAHTHAHADPGTYAHTYVRWHASNGT